VIYDFIPLGEDLLGIAIGDASGHGLAAAILVRDVLMGIRMGVALSNKSENILNVTPPRSLNGCLNTPTPSNMNLTFWKTIQRSW
jgi:serine phosphatase RsbU (regulator of sigma subunit)